MSAGPPESLLNNINHEGLEHEIVYSTESHKHDTNMRGKQALDLVSIGFKFALTFQNEELPSVAILVQVESFEDGHCR
jgi:hypothetical protein